MASSQTAQSSVETTDTLLRKIDRLRRQPLMIATLSILLLITIVFILYPVYTVARESVLVDGQLSLGNYTDFFSSVYFRHTLYNTVVIGALATIGAVLLGLVFAFTITRTSVPGKGFFTFVAVTPLISPPFFTAFAFILLLGRQGIFNRVLYDLFGFRWIIFGWHGVVLAQILTLFPIAFLNLSSALSSIDPRIEEAAEDLGGNYWAVIKNVTLPLLTPAFLSSTILIFMFNVSAFGIPAILGSSRLLWEDGSMLAPEAIIRILGTFDWGTGTMLAMIMLVPSFMLFIFQDWYVRKRSYITVTGIPTSFAPRKAPAQLAWTGFVICALTAFLVISVFLVIFAGAITRAWGANNTLTMRHINLMLEVGQDSIINSLILSMGGALIAASVGVLIAYILKRWNFPGKQGFNFIIMLPYALPGVVVGLGFAAGFNAGPLVLTGTWLIILINFAIRRMPYGVESSKSALSQIDPSLEEAAADMGANWPTILWKITLPLLRPTFIAALVFSFIKAMTDITAVIFLVSPHWRLMSIDIYNNISAGRVGAAAAMASMMIIIIVVILAIIWKVSGLGYRIFKL